MKAVFLLKTITVIMAVFIMVGIVLVARKITDFSTKSKGKFESEFHLVQGEKMVSMVGCGSYLCLMIQKNETASKIVVLNPKTGKLQHVMALSGEY